VVGFLSEFLYCLLTGFGHVNRKAFFFEPFFQGIPDDEFIVHHEDLKFSSLLIEEPDGVRGADFFTFAALRTCGRINDIRIGNRMGYGEINCFSIAQTFIEFIGNFHRADIGAKSAADTFDGIHPVGFLF